MSPKIPTLHAIPGRTTPIEATPHPTRLCAGRRSKRTARGRLLAPAAAGLALVAAAFMGGPAAAEPGDDWHVAGSWRTEANADDVRAMAIAEDGGLWVASASGGVARWSADMSSVRRYRSPQDGLPCNQVSDVQRWRGTWWFATCRGLALYDPGADRMRSVTADLRSPRATSLAVGPDGALWVGTEPAWNPHASPEGGPIGAWEGGGVAVTADGSSWAHHGLSEGLPSVHVADIAVWRDAVWLAMVPYAEWAPPSTDPDGNPVPGRWLKTGGGLARWDGSRWTAWTSAAVTELSDDLRALAAGRDVLWIGTSGRGLVATDGTRWGGLRDCGSETRCVPDNFVTALATGGDGVVWVATRRFNGQGSGIAALDDKRTPFDASDDAWWPLRGESEPSGDLVHSILPTGDAGVWIGSAVRDPEGGLHGRGITRLMDDRRTTAVYRDALTGDGAPLDNDITAIARNAFTGEIWLGTLRDGISMLGADGRWRHYTRASTGGALASDAIADIEIAPGGEVWVATRQLNYDAATRSWLDGGLSRWDGERWTSFTSADGLPSDHLSALALDGRGNLWVGTGATQRGSKEHAYRGWGLAVLDAVTGRWTRTYTFPQLVSNNVTSLAVADGQLWVSTAYFHYMDPRPGGAQFNTGGGLNALDLDTGTWRSFTADQGLTVALSARTAGAGRNLLDLRTMDLPDGGSVISGTYAFPDGSFDPEVVPDGVIDMLRDGRATSERLPGAGPVLAVAQDHGGNLWAGTERRGLRIRDAEGGWLEAPSGLPDSPVDTIELGPAAVWVGTQGMGAARLVPPPSPTPAPETATARPPSASTPEPYPFVWRAQNRIYLPSARTEWVPRLVVDPQAGARR